MISCFSYWMDQHNSYITCHWQYSFMKLWIPFLLRWAFQTQLRNSKALFSCFMGGKQREEYVKGAPNIAAATGELHWSWTKKNRKASGACLGRMVFVELCKLGVSLTQTAKLERHLIIVQFRENGKQNCVYKTCSVRKTPVFVNSFNKNNNNYLPKTPAALWHTNPQNISLLPT